MNQVAPYTPAAAPAPLQQAGINSEAESFIATIGSRPVAVRRDHEAILNEIRILATVGASDLFYEFPVKDNRTGRTSTISGPSIKLANTILAAYGNCGVDTKVTETPEAWVFAATFVDAEKGVTMRRLFRQRRSQKTFAPSRDGKEPKDDGRSEDMAFQIGQSKAIRNVIVNALSVYATYAMEHAKTGLVEAVKRAPAKYRDKVVQRLEELEVPLDIVSKWVGKGPDKWGPADIAKCVSALQGISDGLARIEDIWPDARPPAASAPPADGAPPPPPPAPEASAAKPVARGKKAEAPKDPQPAAGGFVAGVIAEFDAAKTADEIDGIWTKHEARFPELEPPLMKQIETAYDTRREAMTNAE